MVALPDDAPEASSASAANADMMNCAGSSSVVDSKLAKKAQELLVEGKRQYMCKNLPEASKCLASACGVFEECYGQFGLPCADAYFEYGSILFDLAQLEPGVVGVAFDGSEEALQLEDENLSSSPEENDAEFSEVGHSVAANDEEKPVESIESKDNQFEEFPGSLTVEEQEKIQDMVADALAENADESEGTAEVEQVSSTNETEEHEPVDEGVDDGDAEADAENPCDGDVENDEDADPDDISNLQLAWEMVDLARKIYDNDKDNDHRSKIADCYLRLAEISNESGNHAQAIEDQTCVVTLYDSLGLPSDDRRIAEVYFAMGMSTSLNQYEEAVSFYERASSSLKQRLQAIATYRVGETDANKLKKFDKEIQDLNELMPEIDSRIQDCQASIKQNENQKDEIQAVTQSPKKEANGLGVATAVTKNGGSTASTAADISHLVRKPIKRAIDEDSAEVTVKKGKVDDATNSGSDETNVTTTQQ